MSIMQRIVLIGAATTLAYPVAAQRPPRIPPTPPKTAAKPDSTKKATAVSLDFQDQELKVVLDALAAAGDLNVSMTNIPSQRVTVHMGRPVNREGMIELVKSVAESNGLKVTETPTLLQISGPAPEPPQRETPAQRLAQQLAQQQQQQQQVKLFSYRLRHASAVQLAPVLTNLFSGLATTFGGGRGNTTVIPNGQGGFNVFNTGAANPPGNITTQITPPFAVNPGRGGAAAPGRGGGGANPNVGGGIAN